MAASASASTGAGRDGKPVGAAETILVIVANVAREPEKAALAAVRGADAA